MSANEPDPAQQLDPWQDAPWDITEPDDDGGAVLDETVDEAPSLPEEAPSEGRGPTQATLLRQLAMRRYTFGVSSDGAPFALPKDGPRIARPFRGGRTGLRSELAALFAAETKGAVPSASALADALTALEGQAAATDPVDLATRVGEHGGRLYLDLGRVDGQVVEITTHGWRILDEAPVLFRRTALTSPLPNPTPGNSATFEALRDRLNVTTEDWPLVLAWLVAALMPGLPHPVLSLIGEQGTGKSSATELLVNVIDPSPAPRRSMPRDAEQWAVSAAASWVVGLDNVSGMHAWFSDVLCRAVTGDGYLRRMLYSDAEVSVLKFRRAIITNGIDYGTIRGDLAERMVTLELQRISTAQRRTEDAVRMSERESADVLSALLSLTSRVLAVLPGIRLDELPRMADFARVVAAVDHELGTEGLARYAAQAADLAAVVVESDPFASAIAVFAESLGDESWTGGGGALLELLVEPEPRPRSWPTDTQRANASLRRVAPALREVAGVDIIEGKDPKTRRLIWTLGHDLKRKVVNQASQASQPSNVPLTWRDTPKADNSSGFAPESSGFAGFGAAKPGEGSAKPDEGSAKPGEASGFAPDTSLDLRIFGSAKPAKPAKPPEHDNSLRLSVSESESAPDEHNCEACSTTLSEIRAAAGHTLCVACWQAEQGAEVMS